jgi:hypothetical protein
MIWQRWAKVLIYCPRQTRALSIFQWNEGWHIASDCDSLARTNLGGSCSRFERNDVLTHPYRPNDWYRRTAQSEAFILGNLKIWNTFAIKVQSVQWWFDQWLCLIHRSITSWKRWLILVRLYMNWKRWCRAERFRARNESISAWYFEIVSELEEMMKRWKVLNKEWKYVWWILVRLYMNWKRWWRAGRSRARNGSVSDRSWGGGIWTGGDDEEMKAPCRRWSKWRPMARRPG